VENNNMDVWNKVCKTDPKYAKKVSIGRTFTAIDPMYQVRKATEEFGMAGEGWGFEIVDRTFPPPDYVAVTVRVWAKKRENYIEHVGMCGFFLDKDKNKPDGDCIKKAVTDGVTKGLSYFGFSADVFLGMFDDSRYVEGVKKEIAAKQAADKICKLLKDTKDMREYQNITTDNSQTLKKLEAYPDVYVDVQNTLNEVGELHKAEEGNG